MNRQRVPWYIGLASTGAALTFACSLLTPGSSPSSTTNGAGPTGGSTETAGSETFPLTPNPTSVHFTLDASHAVSNKARARAGVANLDNLSGTDAKGTSFNMGVPEYLFTQDPDGTLQPAFGTAVTVTPVASIPDIPFSKGFLAAYQMAPEGLLIAEPATLELTLQGEYGNGDLVGFAADGDGSNFHLFPIDAVAGSGTTTVLMDVGHFSLYGVAEATAQEVTAQQTHPPSSETDQDEDLLAAPQSKTQANLSKEHDRLVKPYIDMLDNLKGNCNDVGVGALRFETWNKRVQSAGQQSYFKDTINTDANVLKERLKDCLKITCPLCIQASNPSNSSGQSKTQTKKPDRQTVNKLLTYSAFMQSIDEAIDNMTDANLWRQISNQCAKNAGLPLPSPHVAECENCSAGTASPLTCPEQ